MLISDSDVGVERERLIGGKARTADVWCERDRHRDKSFCVGCWEENVLRLRGCRSRLEAGELLIMFESKV